MTAIQHYLICCLLIFINLTVGAQENKLPLLPPGSESTITSLPDSLNLIGSAEISKGTIFLVNDQKLAFRNLSVVNDTAFFTSGRQQEIPMSEIMAISKSRTRLGEGTLYGTLGGFLAGIVIAKAVNPDRTVDEWIVDQLDSEEDTQSIDKEDWPYIGISTACGAAIGALVGLNLKKSKVVYHKQTLKADVFPAVGYTPGSTGGIMFSLKITLH